MNRFQLCVLVLALGLAAGATAQTGDGSTPAAEDICTKWGLSGQVNGLCKAYCEAMDCDDAMPQASDQACTRVLDKITTALGDTPFPTCEDADEDGVPNGLDNCPNVANADQADADPSTPEGDACEPVVTCPCLGAGNPAAPATTEELIANAEAFAAQFGSLPFVLDRICEDGSYGAGYSEDIEGTFAVAWGAVGGEQCALSAVVIDRGASEPLFESGLFETLTPEESAACRAVIDAVQAADPFGACAE